jgi:metallo-beta-lactamase family protein
VYVDSPMAVEALARYTARLNELDPDLRPELEDDKAPLGRADHQESAEARRRHARRERQVCAFCTQRFRAVATGAESRQLVESRAPAIIISSSGMATGGRVLNHLRKALPDPRNTVLFVGFQAAGTRGRRLLDGEKEVKIHGRLIPVEARIEVIESMSAHADSKEIVHWLGGFSRPPAATFLVHGEPTAMDALAGTIGKQLGWRVVTPNHGQRVELEPAAGRAGVTAGPP